MSANPTAKEIRLFGGDDLLTLQIGCASGTWVDHRPLTRTVVCVPEEENTKPHPATADADNKNDITHVRGRVGDQKNKDNMTFEQLCETAEIRGLEILVIDQAQGHQQVLESYFKMVDSADEKSKPFRAHQIVVRTKKDHAEKKSIEEAATVLLQSRGYELEYTVETSIGFRFAQDPSSLRIGITISHRSSFYSLVHSCGISQNIMSLYELFQSQRHLPVLVCSHIDNAAKNPIPYALTSAKRMHETYGVGQDPAKIKPLDIFLEIGETIGELTQTLFEKHNKETAFVRVAYGGKLINDLERIFLKCDDTGCYYPKTSSDGVWNSPHFMHMGKGYLSMMYSQQVSECPFVWNPKYCDKKAFTADDFAPYMGDSPEKAMKIFVMEPNLGVGKNCIIPLAIVEKLHRKNPDAFDHLAVLNGDNVRKHKYFLNNVARNFTSTQVSKKTATQVFETSPEYSESLSHLVQLAGIPPASGAPFAKAKSQVAGIMFKAVEEDEKKTFQAAADKTVNKVVFCPRATFKNCFPVPAVLLSHTWEWGLNYLYLEALWCGVPVVHNSEFLRAGGVGYYYEGFDVDAGCDALERALSTAGDNFEETLAKNRAFVRKFFIFDENNVSGYMSLLQDAVEKRRQR